MVRLNQDALALIAIVAVAFVPVRASAQQRDADAATTSIVIRDTNIHPQSPRAARALLAQISEAAMEVCGASSFSLQEYRQSVRASACWRDAMQSPWQGLTIGRSTKPTTLTSANPAPIREPSEMSRPFRLVDVFGVPDFSGNPLAVVSGADGMDSEEMQRITRWLNLSETTFLLPPTTPQADYRVRIFTLAHELPFAGHPTLGSCHAWLEAGGKPKTEGLIMQECGVCLISVRHGGHDLAFAAPPLLRSGPIEEAYLAEIAGVLRIDLSVIVDAQWVDNGPGWAAVMLASAEAVLAIDPVRSHRSRIDIGVVGPHEPGSDTAFELRALFSDAYGAIIEDPVTGSLNASVAQWLFSSGRANGAYVAAQGTRLGRIGRVRLDQDESGQVWVGGRTRTHFQGVMYS